MKISKLHQRLSNEIKNPRGLENPEEFLGPNWKAVLNFWLYVDTLTDEQWKVIEKRFLGVEDNEWSAAFNDAKDAAEKNTSYWLDVYRAAGYAGLATWELIASQELLNQQKPFIFFPLFLNP